MSKQIKLSIVLAIIGGLLTTAAFFMAFFTAEVQTFGFATLDKPIETSFQLAPPEFQPDDGTLNYQRPWLAQKIFYFHVPIAEASFLVFIVAAVFAVLFLIKRDKKYDTSSRIAMETTLIFTTATMITGIFWTRASWGVWWEWEPRLTTYLIMLLLVIAYFVLRNSIEDEERRATYASVFTLFAVLDAPLSFFITRMIPSSHPIVFQSGMATSNLLPFIIGQIGMLMLGYAVYRMRAAEEITRDNLELIKESLEG